ncbi:MAG: sensor histidine kinase [Sumerlaeia bacterium]
MLRIIRQFRENLRKTAFASRLAVGVLTLFLILFNLTLWFLSNRLVRLQEASSQQTLETSVKLISRAINPRDLFFLQVSYDPLLEITDFNRMAIYADSPSVLGLVESFASTEESADNTNTESGSDGNLDEAVLFRTNPRSTLSRSRLDSTIGDYRIALITPDGYLALDGQQLYTEPVLPAYYDDGEMLDRAKAGNLAISGWTTLNTPPQPVRIRHAYFPIFDSSQTSAGNKPPVQGGNRTPLAILQLQYQEPVMRFNTLLPRRLTQLGLLSTLLVIGLWFFLNRLISRSLKFRQAAEQTDRLRALGNLTAGVAHEIRNPLGIILLTLEELRSVANDIEPKPLREEVMTLSHDIQDETKRLEILTEQFLSFTRGHATKPKNAETAKTPLAELTRSTVNLFSKSLETTVKVNLISHLNADDAAAIEPNAWRQILLNILQNSAQAFQPERPGRITLEQSATKSMLVTTIQDNGKGMDKQTLARIFDPFFTTKDQGTGLGLSLSKALLEDAGGSLTVTSEPGKGTQVRLEVPAIKIHTIKN